MISVFNFPPEQLEAFKKAYLPIKNFDEVWQLSIEVCRNDNAGNPMIEQIIAHVFNESTYSVARDIFQIMLWREELITNNATREIDHGKEKSLEEKESENETRN